MKNYYPRPEIRSLCTGACYAGVCSGDTHLQLIVLKTAIKAGGQHENHILAGYYGFNANISFTFQTIKNLYAHPRDLCFGPFCKFFDDF